MKDKFVSKNEYSAVALGNFDGVHMAHREVLKSAKNYSLDNNVKAVSLVFDVHPKNYFSKKVGLLMTDEDRLNEIKKLGLEIKTVSFEKVKDYEGEKFVSEILKGELKAKAVFCGYNYHFGVGGKADVEVLKKICKEYDIEVFVSDKVIFENEAVSSTKLRELLHSGEVEKANKLMNRTFSYSLEVVHGQKRGREMGYPTLNQYFPAELVIPKFGVYASLAEVDSKEYVSFTNIGSRPTFPENDVRSETHIFDFDGDLYGKKVRVSLYKFLRPEIKFTTPENLIKQLSTDKKTAIEYFMKNTHIFK